MNGYDSGECVDSSLVINDMPFCANYVSGEICVPKYKKYFSFNLTISSKDKYIQSIYIRQTESKLLQSIQNPNESVCHICSNKSCIINYKRFLCQFNFPNCNENKESKNVCYKLCTEFTTACGYTSDLCVSKFKTLNGNFEDC